MIDINKTDVGEQTTNIVSEVGETIAAIEFDIVDIKQEIKTMRELVKVLLDISEEVSK